MTDETAVEGSAPATAGGDPFDGPGWSRTDTVGTSGRTKVRVRRRRRRRLLIALGVLALALVAAVGWLLYTGFRARTELEAVRAGVHKLRADISAGDLAAARADAQSVREHADSAYDLTTGPVWASAAAIPYLGDPLATTRSITSNVRAIADRALPVLTDAAYRLTSTQLRRADGTFDLSAIQSLSAPLHHAVAVMNGALAAIAESSDKTWVSSVNTARDDLFTQLTHLTSSVKAARLAATVLPPVLGADGPRTYMVAFQNEAELRGLGGLPGAFAILRADHGKLTFTRFESDTALGTAVAAVNFGREFGLLWPGGPAGLYVNSNESPHFPYAARIWASMWQRTTGQRLDGAIALDPTTLSYLLGVTGPATLPGGGAVSAANIVSLTQQQVYDRFAANNEARKHYLLEIARAVGQRLISSHNDLTGLVRAAGRAAGEYRLLMWARDDAVERDLAPLPLSGVVPPASAPYAGVAMVNTLGSKLDYYLHAGLRWHRSGCGDFRDVTATLTLRNQAPRTGLPRYALGYTGRPGFPQAPGVERLSVYYFASAAAVLRTSSVDGAPVGAYTGYEQGHPVFGIGLTIPPGTTETVTLHLEEPAGTGPPTIRPQPMVNPMSVTVSDSSCPS